MPSASFAFSQLLSHGSRGCQEDLSGFLKTLIKPFPPRNKFGEGRREREKRKFSEIISLVCRATVTGSAEVLVP